MESLIARLQRKPSSRPDMHIYLRARVTQICTTCCPETTRAQLIAMHHSNDMNLVKRKPGGTEMSGKFVACRRFYHKSWLKNPTKPTTTKRTHKSFLRIPVFFFEPISLSVLDPFLKE